MAPPGQHRLHKPFAGHFEALRRLCVPEVVGTEAESLYACERLGGITVILH